MPKIPKWMADAMQSIFSGMYHPVTITSITELANRLRKIRLEGDFSKIKRTFVPGNVIEFRISDTEFRHYTPSYFNQEKGICEVIFYLHDKGPGSKWVSQLKLGDTINLLGPGGRIKYQADFETHIAFGDETSLGVINCIKNETEKQGKQFFAIAELNSENKYWGTLLELDIHSVSKSENDKASSALDKLKIILLQVAQKSASIFYLTGNAKSIQSVKKYLLENGFTNKQIQTEPYWAEGKQGL